MVSHSPRVLALAMTVLVAVSLTQDAQAQISFTNSGQVSFEEGSTQPPISGFLTDAANNSIGYTISNLGPLVFGWNGPLSSEQGGVQHNFDTGAMVDDTLFFQLEFAEPIASLTLSQTLDRTAGGNDGGSLAIGSDAASVDVFAGTQSVGNLNSVLISGGGATATLAPTSNADDDWFINLSNVQSVTVEYDPTPTSGVGGEWLTFSNATILAIPEPSTFFGLTALFAASALRRRRV